MPGQKVRLICNFVSATKPRFTWKLNTYNGDHIFNGSTPTQTGSIPSANLTLWTSKLYIEYFNYSANGNYSCSATDGDKSGKRYVQLSLYGKIWSRFSLSFNRRSDNVRLSGLDALTFELQKLKWQSEGLELAFFWVYDKAWVGDDLIDVCEMWSSRFGPCCE